MEEQVVDSDKKMTMIHRDVSWLNFNQRVINQHLRPDFSAYERFKFIEIGIHNLNEFIGVRYAGYEGDEETKKVIEAGISTQKAMINTLLDRAFDKAFNNYLDIDDEDDDYDKLDLIDALVPVSLSSNKEIPIFKEDEINYFIKLEDNNEENITYCFLQVPRELGRIYKPANSECYTSIDSLITENFDKIFKGKRIVSYAAFKVIKRHDEEVEKDPTISIKDRITKVINSQEKNQIIAIDVYPYDGAVVKKLRKVLGVEKSMVFQFSKSLFIATDYFDDKANHIDAILCLEKPETKFRPVKVDLDTDSIFEYLDDKDLILHHPFESFQTVIDFINEAANDPKVISIRQTLYRVSSIKSPIIKALCDAAKNGKKVVVMLELLARFDEKQNVRLINTLKEAGCTVVYSIEGIKTHAKMCVVARKSKAGVKLYAHMGTGNYNEKTAVQYTDFSYFTSNSDLIKDLVSIFNMITGFSDPGELSQVSYSPFTLRNTLMEEFNACIKYTLEHSDTPALIRIKVNSICDDEIARKIIEAADAGVNIEIICRGICSIVPHRENLKIKSIIGRFLEHSRMYHFRTAPLAMGRLYISSADLLTRNLDKRIEILVPIFSREVHRILGTLFIKYWDDTRNTYWMNSKGEYNIDPDTSKHNIHQELIKETAEE